LRVSPDAVARRVVLGPSATDDQSVVWWRVNDPTAGLVGWVEESHLRPAERAVRTPRLDAAGRRAGRADWGDSEVGFGCPAEGQEDRHPSPTVIYNTVEVERVLTTTDAVAG
jgi:hypothetical protein